MPERPFLSKFRPPSRQRPRRAPVASQFFAPKTQPEAAPPVPQPAAAVPAPDMKQQLTAMRESLREELEAMVQRTVSTSVETVVRQAVEKQIGENYQASIQTLNSDLTYQLVTRLAGNEELRSSIAGMAKKAVDDQIGEVRTTSVEELRGNRASLAELETKMKASEIAAASALERARALEHEIAESLERMQKVVDQLNLSARSTIEKFDSHVTTQLTSWSAQFKNHVDGITREKAAQFTAGLEQQLANQVREANEVLEKLSAGLQLAGVRYASRKRNGPSVPGSLLPNLKQKSERYCFAWPIRLNPCRSDQGSRGSS